MKSNVTIVLLVTSLFIGFSLETVNLFPDVDQSGVNMPHMGIFYFNQRCGNLMYPQNTWKRITQQFTPCVNCTCTENGTVNCVEWYITSRNKGQAEMHKACSKCDPLQFSISVICKCFDDYANVLRKPFELWKPTNYLYCACDSRGIACKIRRSYADNFITFIDGHRWLTPPTIDQRIKMIYPPVSVSRLAEKTFKDCNISWNRIPDGEVQNVMLRGYPRCMKCACYNGNPYCAAKWKFQTRSCSSQSTCKTMADKALLNCENPALITCEKETYSWERNGCHYSCIGGKLEFQMIKKPWCQSFVKTKYCASCGNKTAFLEKYGSKITFCSTSGDLILKENVCDGYPDCQDGSDEKNCTEIYCSIETNVIANRSITWSRMISNSSLQVKCSQINALWKGSFVKTCYHKPRERAKFQKGTYCNCKDERFFNLNMSNVGNSSVQLFNASNYLLNRTLGAVRASQYFESVKNLSNIAMKINHTSFAFWKIIDRILQHDAPCEETEISMQMRNLSRLFHKYHNLSFTQDAISEKPHLSSYLAAHEEWLISEKLILQLVTQPKSTVIRPEKPKDKASFDKVNSAVRLIARSKSSYNATNGSVFVNEKFSGRNGTIKQIINNKETNITQKNKENSLSKAKARLKEIQLILRHTDIATTIETVIGSISIVSCGICLVLCRVFNIEETTKFYLHKNLFISWIMSYGLQIIGNSFDSKFEKLKDFCTSYLIVNQYALLSFYSWMSLEGFNLFMMLTFVFRARMIKKYFFALLGWGLPIFIVAIEVGVYFNSFKKNKSCVGLEKNDWLFKGPTGFLLSMNCMFFCAVIVVLLKRISRSAPNAANASRSRATGKAFLVLLPLLGLTFFLGYGVQNTVVMYIYVVVNSSMGIMLTIFHFFLDETVQSAFKEYRRKQLLKRIVIQDENKAQPSKDPAITAEVTA